MKKTIEERKENRVEIPEGMTVKVVEQKENEILVPLPPPPPLAVEDDLEDVVGAGVSFNVHNTAGPLAADDLLESLHKDTDERPQTLSERAWQTLGHR